MLREAGQRPRFGLQPLIPLDQIRVVHEAARVVERRDRDDLGVEDLPDPVADGVVDRLRVELTRDRLLHAVDQRELGIPLSGLVHQPRVLQRHAQAACERLQQLLVRAPERVLPIDVLEGDHAGRLAARHERHEQNSSCARAALDRASVPLGLRGDVLGDQQRLLTLEHVLREAARRARLEVQPLAQLVEVRLVDEPCRRVEGRDRDDLRVEDLLNPVADDVVDRLLVELAGNRVLHAVDESQLGVPLPRLVHEPRVLQRHAQAAGQRLQQLLVGFAEGMLAADVLERDHSRRGTADDERNEENRLGCSPLDDLAPVLLGDLADVLGHEQRPPCLEHMLREPAGRPRLLVEPLTLFDQVAVVQEAGRRVQHRDPQDLGVEDVPDPLSDGVVDRLRLQLTRDRILHAVDQRQLGVPLPRLVHEPRVLERDAQAARERCQQTNVVVGERVGPVEVLQRDPPNGPRRPR